MPTAHKTAISCSWDDDVHKKWVKDFATRLRSDGGDVTLDQWHVGLGDRLPLFMESMVRESRFVLIIGTHGYKDRFDGRNGDQRISAQFTPGTVAISQYQGPKIWLDPTLLFKTSVEQDEGMLMHEILHKFTFDKDTLIQGKLGLAINVVDDSNIGKKLMEDCILK